MSSKLKPYLIFTLLVLFKIYSVGSEPTLVDNGYSGIVVAFSSQIPEDEGLPLIKVLQEIFTNASRILYQATKGHTYFKDVTFLVPRSWKNGKYLKTTGESFKTASIRIINSDSEEPITIQYEGCGRRGDHIRLTNRYLKNINKSANSPGDLTPEILQSLKLKPFQDYGNPGKTLVHEWAHLRYGIFDEYGFAGNKQYPEVYYDSEKDDIVPNACADVHLKSRVWEFSSNSKCFFPEDSYDPDEFCSFKLDKDNAPKSSLMSFHVLPSVQNFCDEKNHNKKARNKHNTLCNQKSTWQVIMENEDFTHINQSLVNRVINLTPKFEIVQISDSNNNFVLVLDVSGSMDEDGPYTRIMMLSDTVRRWITEEVKIGWSVGVVTFSGIAYVKQKLFTIKNKSDYSILLKSIPTSCAGGTCISCGLYEGINELKSFTKQPGGNIILVSDGEDGSLEPHVDSIINVLKESHITLHSIAFTKSSDNRMETFSKATGGKMFYAGVDTGTLAMGSAFSEINYIEEPEMDTSVKLSEWSFHGPSDGSFSGYFIVDSSVGINTSVNFVYNVNDDINNIIISSDSGKIYNSLEESTSENNSVSISRLPSLKLIKFFYKNLSPGRYNYIIYTIGLPNQVLTVTISSSSTSDNVKPITARCWISEDDKSNSVKYIIIFAEVKQGEHPAIDAVVTAEVTTPERQTVKVILSDNGDGNPDIWKDDGVYSKYFVKTTKAGRYSVKVFVTTNDQTRIIFNDYVGSRSMPPVRTKNKPKEKKTGEFERVADGGSFLITEDRQEVDVFPPGKIFDLSLIKINESISTIVVQWTAPGDDLDDGNATQYEIRYSKEFDSLQSNFSGLKINFTASPKPSGSIEVHTIQIPEIFSNVSLFLAIRTADEVPQWSPVSNIIIFRGQINRKSKYSPNGSNTALKTQRSFIALLLSSIIIVFLFNLRN